MRRSNPEIEARGGTAEIRIRITAATRDKLISLGRKGESYDDIINRLFKD